MPPEGQVALDSGQAGVQLQSSQDFWGTRLQLPWHGPAPGVWDPTVPQGHLPMRLLRPRRVSIDFERMHWPSPSSPQNNRSSNYNEHRLRLPRLLHTRKWESPAVDPKGAPDPVGFPALSFDVTLPTGKSTWLTAPHTEADRQSRHALGLEARRPKTAKPPGTKSTKLYLSTLAGPQHPCPVPTLTRLTRMPGISPMSISRPVQLQE